MLKEFLGRIGARDPSAAGLQLWGVTGSAAIAGVSGTNKPFLLHLLYHLFTFLFRFLTFLEAFSSRI